MHCEYVGVKENVANAELGMRKLEYETFRLQDCCPQQDYTS